MKVCLVSPGRTSTGGSAFTRELLPELRRALDCEVLDMRAPATGKLRLPAEVAGSTHVVFVGSRAVKVPGAHVTFWPLNVAPLEQHVVKMANTSARNRVRHHLLTRRLERSVSAADSLVFGSSHARSLYLAAYVAAATKPYLVNRGGAPSFVAAPPRPVGDRERRLVLVVSHLYPYKGILEFVEALVAVRELIPADVDFRVAGADRDPTYAARVREEARRLGMGERLVIAEADPDEMTELYSNADLAVFASTCENAGSFALYDGLHAGLPTVCSDRSSMPEMVGGAVRLVNPFDRHQFGRCVLEVLESPATLRDLELRAGSWSAAAPTWAGRAEALADFLRSDRTK